jgi:hypothetical protein
MLEEERENYDGINMCVTDRNSIANEIEPMHFD